MDTIKTGLELIAEERKKQVEKHGYAPEHDDQHTERQLIDAAFSYITVTEDEEFDVTTQSFWPWENGKPAKSEIDALAKAGALIAAEIDRLQRLPKIDEESIEAQ